MALIIILFCLTIVASVFLAKISKVKLSKSIDEALCRYPKFQPEEIIKDIFYLAKDDSTQKFLFVSKETVLFNYADIISINLSVNGNDIMRKSISETISGSLIGGVLGGGIGAIIGGLSSAAQIDSEIHSIDIHIILRNQIVPSINLEFLSTYVKKGDFLYEYAYGEAKRVLDILTIAMDKAKHDTI